MADTPSASEKSSRTSSSAIAPPMLSTAPNNMVNKTCLVFIILKYSLNGSGSNPFDSAYRVARVKALSSLRPPSSLAVYCTEEAKNEKTCNRQFLRRNVGCAGYRKRFRRTGRGHRSCRGRSFGPGDREEEIQRRELEDQRRRGARLGPRLSIVPDSLSAATIFFHGDWLLVIRRCPSYN